MPNKHYHPTTGQECNCGWHKEEILPFDQHIAKTASKIDWIEERADKFFNTPEGQNLFRQLKHFTNSTAGAKLDALVPWIWREAKKGRLPYTGNSLVPASFAQLDHMVDWFNSNSPTRRGVDIMQLSWEQMEEKIKEWDEELASKKSEEAARALGGAVVHDVGDGWTIKQIKTKEEAKAEGDMMGHCVGSYGEDIEDGSTNIYSLRDPKNQPHATIEINPDENKVVQIEGKGNQIPIPEYQKMVGSWLMSMGDNKPKISVDKKIIRQHAPRTVEDLYYYVNPYEDDLAAEYESEEASPTDWREYFERDYDEDMETEVIQDEIEDESIGFLLADIFDPSGGDETSRLKAQDALTYLSFISDDLVNQLRETALNYLIDEIIPYFKDYQYEPSISTPIEQQWADAVPEIAISYLVGDNFFNDYVKNIEVSEPDPDDPMLQPPLPPIDQSQPDAPEPDNDDFDEFGNPRAASVISKVTNRFRRNANILDEVHQYLSPEVWEHANAPMPNLREDIAQWIPQFITEALERNGYTDMGDWLSFVLTGSLTTYQYSDKSDCDISLFVNAEMFPEWSRAEMIAIMMDECDGVPVPGTVHELQCYVVPSEFTREDLYKPGMRSAYDIMERRWIVPPEKDRSHNVKSEMNEAYTIALENADKMEKLIRYEPLKAIKYYDQIHRRRRRDMQAGSGDFSPSNISYKMMEDRGLFDQVHSLMKQYERAY